MPLIRELWRVLTNTVAFSVSHGKVWLLVAIALVAFVAMVTTSVTVIGPVAVYPFL